MREVKTAHKIGEVFSQIVIQLSLHQNPSLIKNANTCKWIRIFLLEPGNTNFKQVS